MKHALVSEMTKRKAEIFAKIGPAKCLCYRAWDAMWFVKEHVVVCSHCHEERSLSDAPAGILVLPCCCGAGDEATWFVTAKGTRVCSNCGDRK